MRFVLAETKLFAYPAGWMNTKIGKILQWSGPASDRFREWFRAQDEK